MAATTMFKPSTDDFGQLTMHATILGEQTFGNLSRETRQAHVNLLIMLAFLVGLTVAGIGIYKLDQAFFAHPHAQASVRALPIDYN
jgi:hypothetical protein